MSRAKGKRSGAISNSSTNGSSYIGRVYYIEDYRLTVDDVIAEGGFAVVLLVKSSSGQKYALKRLAVNNEQDLYLAKQEIAITKALSDSTHSVTYITSSIRSISADVYEVLLLLKHYNGQSAIDILNSHYTRGAALADDLVLKIFTDVCQAVARLHHRTKPIIHRDLKVENILSDGSHYVLCDFGSCSVRPMHPEVLGATECEEEIAKFTTLAYRAPEMVSVFSGKTITTKSDIWALGCLLYKLCFFTTPFGEHPLAIVSAQLTIPDNSTFSDSMHSLIAYLLQGDAEKRPNIWQVCEIAFSMRKLPNPVPNVFKSPPPNQPLPLPKRTSEAKETAPPKKSNHQSHGNMATPLQSSTSHNSRVQPLITTSISSRERPRGGNSRTHLPTKSSSPPLIRAHHANTTTNNLSAPSLTSHCSSKSLDSGLDAFGCVPFTPESTQSAHVQASGSHGNQTTPISNELRRDLFGSVPFQESSCPPMVTVDDFGAQPFVL